MTTRISEFDVLVPTALWLVDQGCFEMKASIAPGQGRRIEEQKTDLKERLKSKGFTDISFAPRGPDLIARGSSHIWKVECKGLSDSSPKTGTVRARFFEAFAQVVSYYGEPAIEGGSDLRNGINRLLDWDKPIRLVLALPRSGKYLTLLRKRAKLALRRQLDLWLLIIDPETKSVECYDPNHTI